MHLAHLLAAYSVLLSNLSTALRDETSRLSLEAGEAEVGEEAAKGRPQLELTSHQRADHYRQGDAGEAEVLSLASCINGTLELRGKNVVNTDLVFPEECVELHGDPGSQVILEKPLVFRGHLRMDGDIHFFATRAFKQPCVRITGNTSAFGNIHFENCRNEVESEGGGLGVVGGLMQHGGTMQFRNCSSAGSGGGLYVSHSLTQRDGLMKLQNCHAEYGGGLYSRDVRQNNGTMEFKNCSSVKNGGGLYVWETLKQRDSLMKFLNCHAEKNGGGLYSDGTVQQNNGTMEFKNCSSKAEGGGLYSWETVQQNNGTMEFKNCSSKNRGGGLYTTGNVEQNNGTMEFKNCSSKGRGGGLYTTGNVEQDNGTMEFKNCSSKNRGGGLYVSHSLTQRDGLMKFQNCHAEWGGGGLSSYNVEQNNATMEFNNCSSEWKGGGLWSHWSVTQNNGTMEFKNCSSVKNGGGLHVDALITQNNGRLEFKNCSSEENGGGMYISGEYLLSHGAVVFHHCVAKENGGGLWAHQFQQKAPVYFKNCVATIGGGLDAYMVNGTQPMSFHQCQATEAGGGIRIQGLEGSGLQNVYFEECAAGRASAIQARNLTIQSLVLVDTFNQTVDAVSLKVSTATFHVKGAPDLSMEAVDLQIDSDVDCSQLRECRLIVTSSAPKLGRFWCSLGAGVAQHPAFGCLACPEGYTQIENVTNGSCHQCPKGASLCHAAKIQMMHGFMLDERNVSRPFHCPTKAACHGGELPVNEGRPMCQKGYGGEGCASCVKDEGTLYLMPDSSVLACTRCATDSVSQLLQWCSFVGQRVVLFVVSSASIFAAGHADSVKNSGVYLNQLMAFAAVSGCVVTSVMQTETAQTMKNVAVQSLYGTAVFLSEAGSGQGSKSSHCLLSYLGLESTGLFGVHCLDLVVATSLVLLLSLKDFRVALVAGLNCFLPGILADFAKYAVCYSLEEDQTGGMEDLICNHLPLSVGNLLGFIAVGACFLTVFAGSLLVWIRLSTSEAKEEPSHVAFLTNKYEKGRRYFEAERLVRKVLLATAAALYPSTTFPELQMTGLTIITGASMCLYGIFHPYCQKIWNWSELGLLLTALLLIAMASAVISNEEKWDKTETGQTSMIITLGAIVTAVCSVFMIKIAMEIWHERWPTDRSHPE